jgi:carboxyl-terminal processing protease
MRAWARSILTASVIAFSISSSSQQISSFDRDRARMMLDSISSDVRKHYYDPKFHGITWDEKVSETKQKIGTAPSFNGALSNIAAALDTLNDSHTFFLPPGHAYRHDYGWQMQMVGDHCFVTRVRPKSDAEVKGLKPGDEILALNGYRPTRDTLWKLEYMFNALRPQPGLRLAVQSPDGAQRQLDVAASIRPLKKVMDLTGEGATFDIFELIREEERETELMRTRSVEFGDDVMVLKFPSFDFTESEVGSMLGKARKHKALIIDLRENGGGSEETLKAYLAGIFDHDVKIGDRVMRNSNKPMMAKSHSHNVFAGKLIVLVDSQSASASELLARVVQLEKRGTVIGDHTSGSVMEAKHYQYHQGMDQVVFFGASITEANILMSDGNSLEHTGVVPDELALPKAADLASGSDPVLAHAVESCGVKLSAEHAGKLFPYEWAKN